MTPKLMFIPKPIQVRLMPKNIQLKKIPKAVILKERIQVPNGRILLIIN